VGCTEECLYANINEVKLFQDWYRFELMTSGPLKIELAFDRFNHDNEHYNDLDMYLFAGQPGEQLLYQTRSTEQPGQSEVIYDSNLAAGTYYLTIQAWDTPTDRVPYWLSIR
jgi:hypothetical protein